MSRQYPWDGNRVELKEYGPDENGVTSRFHYLYDQDSIITMMVASSSDSDDPVQVIIGDIGVYISKEHFLKIAHDLEAEDKQPGDLEVESDIKMGDFSFLYNYPTPPKSEYQITVPPSGYEYSAPKADSISSSRTPRRTAVMDDIQEAMDILERARKNCEELRRSL